MREREILQVNQRQKHQKAVLQCMLLEMGILFHSVFIGMALSVSVGKQFYVLLIAITFHRKLSVTSDLRDICNHYNSSSKLTNTIQKRSRAWRWDLALLRWVGTPVPFNHGSWHWLTAARKMILFIQRNSWLTISNQNAHWPGNRVGDAHPLRSILRGGFAHGRYHERHLLRSFALRFTGGAHVGGLPERRELARAQGQAPGFRLHFGLPRRCWDELGRSLGVVDTTFLGGHGWLTARTVYEDKNGYDKIQKIWRDYLLVFQL